jgi:hypothetical protein
MTRCDIALLYVGKRQVDRPCKTNTKGNQSEHFLISAIPYHETRNLFLFCFLLLEWLLFMSTLALPASWRSLLCRTVGHGVQQGGESNHWPHDSIFTEWKIIMFQLVPRKDIYLPSASRSGIARNNSMFLCIWNCIRKPSKNDCIGPI